MTPDNHFARLALTQWTRAAAQRNIDALVKVGDYYYHGLGVPDEPEQIRLEKAARYYQSASDTQMSALAMWNLGWMYENGIGVPQVFFFLPAISDVVCEPLLLGFSSCEKTLRSSSGNKFRSISTCSFVTYKALCT